MDEGHLRGLVAQYLSASKLMQLATAADGQPWVCSVWFVADDDLNVFWFSASTRRHSLEVANNRRVAGAIALPQTPEDAPRGLQFEGVAEVLTESQDIAHARKYYADRIFSNEKIDEFINHEQRPHEFYRVRPSQFVLFDVVNFPDDPRQELHLQT